MAEKEIQSDVNTIYANKDIWRNIALKLDRRSIYMKSCSLKWFAVVVIADDTLFRELLLGDLGVTVAGDLDMEDGVTWKITYDSIFGSPPPYNPIYIDSHRQTDVYTGMCPVCEAECGETKTILTLWHSKLYLMDGPFDPSANDLDLADMAMLCYNINGLNLDFTNFEGEKFETEFKVVRIVT